jgi:hypothetical protein
LGIAVKKFGEWLYEMTSEFIDQDDSSTQGIINRFLQSEIGKRSEKYDCKTVTRNFVNWCREQKITDVRVLHLSPPSAKVVSSRPELRGKSGTGDSHIMPVVNGDAIDFTARQFGVSNQFNNPLVTPLSRVKGVYSKIGGYFTDKPDDFYDGKDMYLGDWDGVQIDDFADEYM